MKAREWEARINMASHACNKDEHEYQTCSAEYNLSTLHKMALALKASGRLLRLHTQWTKLGQKLAMLHKTRNELRAQREYTKPGSYDQYVYDLQVYDYYTKIDLVLSLRATLENKARQIKL